MTREQFIKVVELGQEYVAISSICKGVGVDLNSFTFILNKIINEYFNYVDPTQRGLPIVMYFITNSYYPLPDGQEVIQLRDVSKLYDFWLVCVKHGNPASSYITSAVNDYKKDLE